jgi:CRP/FNR family transcriptional regulator, cyclic AMP receptor protein
MGLSTHEFENPSGDEVSRMKAKGEASSEIQIFLADLPLLSRLSESSVSLLARAARTRHVEKGEILFFQSDPSDAAYIVRAGIISIILSSPDGREMVINEMHRGDLFGELGIITKKARSTSALARTKSELLVIPGQTFLHVIDREPQLALQMLEVTANRLQMSGKRESALAFLDAQARLARLLLQLEAQEMDKGYVTISQEELAHHTGLTRQTVAKALGKWRRAGWLITGRGRILILNRRALEELEDNLLV